MPNRDIGEKSASTAVRKVKYAAGMPSERDAAPIPGRGARRCARSRQEGEQPEERLASRRRRRARRRGPWSRKRSWPSAAMRPGRAAHAPRRCGGAERGGSPAPVRVHRDSLRRGQEPPRGAESQGAGKVARTDPEQRAEERHVQPSVVAGSALPLRAAGRGGAPDRGARGGGRRGRRRGTRPRWLRGAGLDVERRKGERVSPAQAVASRPRSRSAMR